MEYQEKDNEFCLFKNTRKREGKKDPDYTGRGLIHGRTVWVDAWINRTQTQTYMKCRVRPRQTPTNMSAQAATSDQMAQETF